MKTLRLLFVFSILCYGAVRAQNAGTANRPVFPQGKLNSIGKTGHGYPAAPSAEAIKPKANSSAYQSLQKIEEVKKMDWQKYSRPAGDPSRTLDTIYVGVVPHDTMFITGPFNHNGPIFVFNDGVLIFYNATVTNTGDIFVFQHGRVLGQGSSLTFPQTYFYQRSLIVVQNGIAYFNTCNFNYSGIQHNLVIGDSGQVGMENVHQADWTTAGLYGKGTIFIHGLNLGGEYILSDTSTAYFSNVDTLLLWHKVPQTAVLNYAFPDGDTVMNYAFNNSVPGVSGIGYQAYADSCHDVMWALMPVNGSDVTISNSDIRAIGNWFERGDTATVNGVFNNTLYANTVLPFTDRNIHLVNTNVMTWSLYVFDSSRINIFNSTVGEVGTEQKANVISQQFLLDGSGGYFWATDTSAVIASDVTVYSTARSERNGTFVLAYSWLPFSAPSSIHTSLFISVQNTLPADPIPYDGSTMWLENIESPSVAHADSLIAVRGSEWIDQGPMGSPVDYGNYSLYYQLQGDSVWTPIVSDSTLEIRHNKLAMWNTTGLTAGNYILRMLVKDNGVDSVEDFKAVTILPGIATGINNEHFLSASVSPNPATDQLTVYLSESNPKVEISIYNLLGQREISTSMKGVQTSIDVADLAPGTYIIETRSENKVSRQRFIKK